MVKKKFIYSGSELQVFKYALNWKNYYKDSICEYINDGDLLEVGAGIGEITKLLRPFNSNSKWIAVEPDQSNAKKIIELIDTGILDKNIIVSNSFIEELKIFDSSLGNVIFIDSLEHIEKDKIALQLASNMVAKGGHIVVIVPAHNFLFNEFDAAVGHYRRYNKKMLFEIIPASLQISIFRYIDSMGFFLSLANKFLLKNPNPSLNQIKFWDGYVVPISRVMDRILNFKFGKNIILIAKKIQ